MHICPDCGQACYCGGDCDDIDVGSLGESDHCNCPCWKYEGEDDSDCED